jgi:energy-coupling factor transport system permease protein
MSADRLDSRAWVLWGAAAVIPLLVARNPFVVFVVLVSVLAVRIVWASRARQGWQWIVRVAVLFMAIGIMFNALTVHAGDQVLFALPDEIPLIGGRITLNAIAYGVVSGLAIVTLVLAGTTVAAGLIWADLMRSMPPRVAPIAVAGSVAWSFLPSAAQAFQEIRESQAARGHRIRGLRDLPPLVVPLLGGGLERAITMSEALESRGFGHSGTTAASSSASRWPLVGAIGSGLLMAYAFAVGETTLAVSALALAIGLALVSMRISPAQGRRTTRYRASSWARPDWIVACTSLMALLIFFWRNWAVPDAAVFNPYPRLSWPATDLWMLLGLALLIVPALIVPAAGEVV